MLKLNDYDSLPEYDQALLVDSFDNIMQEYEKHSGTMAHSDNLRKANSRIRKINTLIGLKYCLMKMVTGSQNESVLADLKYFGVTIDKVTLKTITKVKNKILSKETNLRLSDKRELENNVIKKNELDPYIEMIGYLKTSLTMNIDENSLTVAEMCYYLRQIKRTNAEAKKRLEKHGR